MSKLDNLSFELSNKLGGIQVVLNRFMKEQWIPTLVARNPNAPEQYIILGDDNFEEVAALLSKKEHAIIKEKSEAHQD